MAILAPPKLRNPFPGLRPFRESESENFFGLEDQVDALLAKLGSARFVALIGISGCGKSSLVRAGLIAELRQGDVGGESATAPRWRVAICRPGNDPVTNLAQALEEALP